MSRNRSESAAFEKQPPRVSLSGKENTAFLSLSGQWRNFAITSIEDALYNLDVKQAKEIVIDLSHITEIDTAGSLLICRFIEQNKKLGRKVITQGLKPSSQLLFSNILSAIESNKIDSPADHKEKYSGFFEKTGKLTIALFSDIQLCLHLIGATITTVFQKATARTVNKMGFAALIVQMGRIGAYAVPIISLMSFIVGAIIAQQGAYQLRYFGAEILVVNLVGLLVFRELGVLLTAILVAGRSASSITAEIGSMKMREEIDALNVMGFDPFRTLIFPRLVALVFTLPLLTIVSNLAALLGASMATKLYCHISYETFFLHLRDAVTTSTYWIGLIKAPFIAMIVGVIATMEGLKVKGSAESLGQHVTTSVVKAIFMVIVTDGIFAIFYASVGL